MAARGGGSPCSPPGQPDTATSPKSLEQRTATNPHNRNRSSAARAARGENWSDPCLLIGERITRRTGIPRPARPVTQPCLGGIAFETRPGGERGRSEVAELGQSSRLTTGISPWHVASTCQCRDSSWSETLVARKALTLRPLLPVWAAMWASIGCEPSELSEGRRHWERFFDASETRSRNIEHQQQIEAARACTRLLRTAIF